MSNLSIEKQIVVLAHIQNYLAGRSEIKNQAYLYSKIKSSLQHLMNETISGLEPKSLDELVDELRTFAGHEQIALFDEMITENRVQQIKNLRKHAIGQNRPQNSSIDLSIFYPGYTHIPIEVFSWQPRIETFNRLVDDFSGLTYESFCKSSLDFFGNISEGCLPIRLPEPTDRIIQELIARQLVSPMDAGDSIDDVNRIRRKISDIRKENRKKIYGGELCAESFARMGDDAYGFLNDYWHNSDLKHKFDICEYLIPWPGPGKAGFLKKLVEQSPCDKHFELCLACTGIYPPKNAAGFKSGADIESKKEQNGFEKLHNIIQENKFVYDFLYISNFEGQGEILQSQRWESLFEKNRHLLKVEEDLKEPMVQKVFASQKSQETRQQGLVKSTPQSVGKEEIPDVVFSADDIDIENLSAYEKPLKGQDKIAHEHSTWNKYLKPFLSENLLGILGAALLMLAWLCISIWVWNKGHYYRLLTGALPMYLTSFCLAFISRFFHKNLDKGVSARAPALFAGLCVLSVPFNYLVALSMFNMNNVIGPLAGIGLAVVYGFTLIFIIGKKIKDSFGFNPGAYLTIVNTILLLSAFLLFISREMRFLAVHIILFATFFIMAYQVYKLKFREPSTHRFCTLVFAGNYLLTIFICCVYYRVVPDPGSIAVLAQLISLFIIYTDSIRQVYKQMIVAAVISILGILICLNAVLPLMPVCMALSFWAWFQFKRKVDSYWLDDILVGHIFLLSGAVLFELQALIFPHWHLLMPWIALSGALGVACSYVYEKKHRETKSVSLMLIFVQLSFQAVLLSPGLNTMTGLSLVMLLTLAVGVYGYDRYAQLYLKLFWFINLAILLAAPSLGLAIIGLEDEAMICLAFSGFAWTLISPKLKDALAHSNKTGVAFVLNIVAGCAFIHVCLTSEPSLSKAGFLLVPAFIALLLSLAVTARKTMSQLPVYAAFLIAVIFGSMVWEMTGIQMKSGLGTSIAAMAALFLSHQFKVRSTWQTEAYDMVFNHELPLRSKSFLYFPFELAGWAMAVMALIKASLHFTLLNSGPWHFNVHAFKVVLALITVLAVFCYFIKKYNFKNCGYIVLWPIGFILVSVSSYVPLIFIAPWCLVLFFLYDYCCRAVTIKPDYKESISIPMKQLNFIFNYFSIAFAFFLYPFYMVLFPGSGPGRILLAASVAMAVVYIHSTLVVKKIERYGHLVPLHLIILIVLGYCSFNRQPIIDFLNTPAPEAFLNILGPSLLKLLIFVAATLLIPGFILEKKDNTLLAGYCRIFHVWLFAAACIIGVIIPAFLCYQVFYPLHPDLIKNLPYIIVAGLFLVHAGNRYFHSLFLYGMKAYFCVCTAFLVFNSLFVALISGMILFSLFEGLLVLGVKHDICRPMESRPGQIDYKRRLAHACELFVFACLTVHFVGFLTLSKPLNHFLLYLLIPYMLFSYRARIKDSLIKDFLGFATVGIFAYANVFVFSVCYPVFLKHQLNSLHLFSASVIFTIAAFQVYEKIKTSIKKEATQ